MFEHFEHINTPCKRDKYECICSPWKRVNCPLLAKLNSNPMCICTKSKYLDSPTSYRSCMFLNLEGVEPPQVCASTAVYRCSQENWWIGVFDSQIPHRKTVLTCRQNAACNLNLQLCYSHTRPPEPHNPPTLKLAKLCQTCPSAPVQLVTF